MDSSHHTQQMKAWARAIRERADIPWLTLSHGQALELFVALTSLAPSWNAWVPLGTDPQVPQSIEAYFGAVTRGQRRINELGVAPSATRSGRSCAAIACLGIVAGTPDEPLRLPWELLAAAGVPVPNVAGYDQAAVEADPEQFLELRLGGWFFRENFEVGEYPWDETARLATSMGFAGADVSLIREIQREAPNHAWRLYSWLEVGVLDPDQAAFLRELQREPGWQERFRRLLRTDDGKVPSPGLDDI